MGFITPNENHKLFFLLLFILYYRNIHLLVTPDTRIDFYTNSNINSTSPEFPESSESTVNKTIIIENTDIKRKPRNGE